MISLTVEAHREQMLRWLEADRGYEFLTVAAPYLDACPDDHYVRLMAIREYLKLDLVVPARELLDVELSTVELPPELTTIRESLAMVGGAPIPWSRQAERFEANLAALGKRGVAVAPIREAWTDKSDQYEWFRDKNGLDQVRMRDGGNRWRWIPRLGDHRAVDEAQALPQDIGKNTPGPYLFEGLDLGWYFERVYKATQDTFLGYSCALFVVEPDAAALALVLHLHNWREILSDQRVFWFIGDSCTDGLRRAWDNDLDLPFPRRGFTLSGFRAACSPTAVEVVQEVVKARETAVLESFQDIERHYAPHDVHHWAKRFDEALSGRGEPLRILAAVSTHTTFLQHSMRDAKRAFESLGHKCIVLTEKTSYHTIGLLTYHNTIREFDPDLFFNIDHLRPEFGGMLPTNLPLLTWDQDLLPHVFTKANVQGIGKLDCLVGRSTDKYIEAGCDPRQCLHARIPTCPEQFSGEPLTEEERRRYTCDISYVSHASQTPQAFHEQERTGCQDCKLQELLDTMYKLTPSALSEHGVMAGDVAKAILKEASQRCGVAIRDEDLHNRLTGWYLWRLGDRLFRHEALEWVAQWARQGGRTFRIYGNGWDKHPTLASYAAGPAQNGRELLCVYRASRINLQLMPAGFLHQRVLDGLAAGAFFLVRGTGTDQRNPVFADLSAAIRAKGLKGGDEVLERGDKALATAFREALHDLGLTERDAEAMFQLLSRRDQLDYPAEIFPRFSLVRFADYDSFATAADRFLQDSTLRQSIAEEMRRVVLERFTYEAAMRRFLQFIADYFSARAAELSS
ncbi:MAG: glycosyltransferase [Phycisphaerae bacterium]